MIAILIWRNIWRNKRRSLITMSSVSIAILLAVSMKSLQKGVFDNLVKNVVSFYSGYIQVHKSGYFDEQVLDNSFNLSDSLLSKLNKIDHVTGVVARIESFALASSGNATYGCMVVGTQPKEENLLTGLKAKLISGKYFENNENSIIISEGLAKRLSLKINDTLTLLGQGYQGNTAAGKYAIKGLARFGSPQLNDMLVFLPLRAAQNLLSAEDKVTTMAVNIDSPLQLESTGKQIEKTTGNDLEVLTWKKIMPDIEAHIRGDNVNFYIYIGVLYFLTAFGIFGTVLMMLSERKYELGMLIAIGMKRIRISLMLIGETILISILGTICGMLISLPVVKYFQVNPIRMSGKLAEAYKYFGFEPLWPAAIDVNIFITQAVIVLCIALAIGIFPFIRIQQMDPVSSMKK